MIALDEHILAYRARTTGSARTRRCGFVAPMVRSPGEAG